MEHKQGCEWKGIELHLYHEGRCDAGISLDVTEKGVEYIDYDNEASNKTLKFNYCPICGINLKD